MQKGPPWPPPVQLERLLSMVFCCSVRKCKMKLLKGEIRDLIMLSNMISKHRAYALCIHGKISWPPPILVWSSDQHQFNKSTCLWRDSLMCYSYLIIKFNFSGCLQSICLDQRNEVDKFQLDVKIFITNYSDYWTTVAPNSIWGSEVKIYTIICMLDRFKCNGAMANSFRVFVLSPFAQSRNSALIVWPGDLQLLVELKQCANKKNKKVLDLDLYCFVFAYGLLLMWPRFILHMAWLTCYSDDVVVHSNDQIAGPLLNEREVWLKHNSPMLQLASSEVLQRSVNVISVLLRKHHVST